MPTYDAILFGRTAKHSAPRFYLPPGIHRIATEIRKIGLTCQVINYMDWFTIEELYKLLPKYIGINTKVIGFSTTFWRQDPDRAEPIQIANLIIEYALERFPNIKIIAGGSEAHRIAGNNFKKIDAIFLDFPEDILSKYLIAIRDHTAIPIETERCSISNANIYKTANSAFDFNYSKIQYEPNDYVLPNSTVTLEVGRGCIFKCKFCSFKLNGKKKLDHIKCIDTLREELVDNYAKHNIQSYIMSDDTFNDSTDKLEILHALFTSLPFKIYFAAYLRLDLINAHREQIMLLKEMGLVGAFFGVESFHPKAASNIGKGLNPVIAKQLLYDLKHQYWKNEVKITVGLITGLPYETVESYEETKKWIVDPSNLVDKIGIIPLYLTAPDERTGSELSEFDLNAAKYGFYWSANSPNWKNMYGPIFTFEQAKKIRDELEVVCQQVNKSEISASTIGSFGAVISWNSRPDTPVTLPDVLAMTPNEYLAWRSIKDPTYLIQDYKEKLLYENSDK